MYQNILFDLDGTLTNSELGITNSVAYALEKFGIQVQDKKELRVFYRKNKDKYPVKNDSDSSSS